MKTEMQEVCGLCLEKFFSKCEILDKTSLEVMKNLQIEKLNFPHTESTLMCNTCMEQIKDALYLRKIYLELGNSQISSKTIQTDELCQLCKHYFGNNSAFSLLEMLKENNMMELFQKYIPEIDLRPTQISLICETCQKSLIKFKNFALPLCGIDAALNDANKFKSQVIDNKDSCLLESTDMYKLKMRSMDFIQTNLNENQTIEIMKHLEDNIKRAEETKIKQEFIDDDDNNNDTAEAEYKIWLFDDESSKTIFKEDVKNENDIVDVTSVPEVNDIDHEMNREVVKENDDYVKFQLKNEEVDIKSEPEDCLTDGSGANAFLKRNTLKRKAAKKIGKINNLNVKKIKIYKCEQCNYLTQWMSSFKKHTLSHKSSDEVEMHQCHQCNFQTKYKYSLRNHILVHKNLDELDMHRCPQCTFQSKHKGSLKSHVLTHAIFEHGEAYKCQECCYLTKCKEAFKRHVLIHKNSYKVKMYKCRECSYESKFKSALKKHIVNHKNSDDVEIHKCQFKDKFKMHTLSHKNSDEAEMHECQQCTYKTKFKGNLKRHMETHVNSDEAEIYYCEQCNYQTKCKRYLREHVVIHKKCDNVEMQKCPHCTYQTKIKRYLRRHMMVHKNYKEITIFKCHHCKFETKFKNYLKLHILSHKASSLVG